MSKLYENFARSAQDFDNLFPGETLVVGMPDSILTGHAFLLTDIDLKEGKVILRNITDVTYERFSDTVKDLIGKKLTREQDERFIIKAGPVEENEGYILTDSQWGEKYSPHRCGFYNLFANAQALDIIAEGFGPDDFLFMRGAVTIDIQEMKDLLDKKIIAAVEADPDIVFSPTPYEEALEKAVHFSILDSFSKGPGFEPK